MIYLDSNFQISSYKGYLYLCCNNWLEIEL